MNYTDELTFLKLWDELELEAETIANEHGFYHKNDAESLMLIVSELSEGLEYLRKGNLKSDHIDSKGIEEELADVIIRIMHLAKSKGWYVGKAILKKMKYNKSRPFKHGNKLF